MKRNKGEKIPKEWVICPRCDEPYGFIYPRVTMFNPRRDMCMKCYGKEMDGTVKKPSSSDR